ncbi:hypothetical protein [Flavivirga algicola]|uniref:WG repeat-containing protein n=1 Tax=Flavivirga algicola TaxID=2729136 RepID=A0ABX1RVX9_9FLAO|nr:hypothetical protein [Flavivirga algicola]NMH87720.1 hypothetical protein [Flavivirga algicola]
MNRILTTSFLLLCFTAFSQVEVDIPKSFVETEIPESSSDEWRKLNHARNEFGVEIIDNKLNIEIVKERNNTELKIDGGTLIGINRGEWGGKLSFIPNNKDRIEIKEGNIKFIFEFKDKIYFIEGLAHLSFNRGAIFELKKVGENFSYEKILEFNDAPEAFTIYEDKLLIATHQNFYVVEDFNKDLIFENTFWYSLYPNSIAVIDIENVYLGIRSGLVKLDLTNETMIFYKNVE